MKKRVFALLMALCMVASLLPVQMVSAEGAMALPLDQKVTTVMNAGETLTFTADDVAAGTYSFELSVLGNIYFDVVNNENGLHYFEGGFQEETATSEVDLDEGSYTILVSNNSTEDSAEVSVMLTLVSLRDDGSGEDTGDGSGDNTDDNTGDGEGSQDYTAIYFRASEADFTIYNQDEVVECYFMGSVSLLAGETLADHGYTVTDPVYWEPSRPFLGWMACTYEELPDGAGSVAVQIPGTEIMSSEEILSYPALPDYQLEFIAQWGGEEDDYFSNVCFDGYGGMFEITYEYGDGESNTYEMDYDGQYCREGVTIRDNILLNYENMELSDPVQEGYTFEGWLEYIWFDEVWTLVSETVYSTEELFGRIVTGEDMVYVAKWAEKDMQEYYQYGQNGGEDGGNDGFEFVIPEDAEVTELTLDQKVSVEGQSEQYFSFIAPATGYYDLRVSNDRSGFDIFSTHGYIWLNSNVCMVTVHLEEGEVFQFVPYAPETTDLWISKSNEIIDLEILSQDTTRVFQKSNNVAAYDVIKGLTIQVTFQDGTTRTVTLPDSESFYMIDGFEPVVSFDFEQETGTTATVTLYYGDAYDSFQVNLVDKVVTQMEILADEPIEVVENTYGYTAQGMNGYYFRYNPYQILANKADFRFTWSDGSQETVSLTYGEEPIYYGVELYFWDTQDEESWTVGTTNTVDIWYGDLCVSASIQIVESPIEKLEIISEPTAMLGEPDFKKASDGTWEWYSPNLSGLEFTITLKDQTTQTYGFDDWKLVDEDYYVGDYIVSLDIEDDDPLYGITGPCDIPLILLVGGARAEFNLHVVEKVVEEGVVTVSPSVVEDQLDGSGTVEVDATTDNTDTPAVSMPAASVEKVAEADAELKVNLDNAQVILSEEAVETIAEKSNGKAEEVLLMVENVAITDLTDAQQALIEEVAQKTQSGAAMVLDVFLSVDGEPVRDFDGKITIRVPFTPPAGTKGEDFDVYYLSADGKTVQKMPTTYADGYLTFVTDHFSDYVALNGEPEGSVDYTPAGTGSDSGNGSDNGSDDDSGTTKPTEPVPNTGDEANLVGYFTMLMVSGMLAAAMFVLSKKVRV